MITPPINENFWIMRVPLSKTQAVVAFPKFSVIGIGFQKETDWNTNLPSGTCAIEIYEHIKHNKGDAKIPRGACIEAICMLQKKAMRLMESDAIEDLKKCTTNEQRLASLSRFLRKAGNHEVAITFEKP